LDVRFDREMAPDVEEHLLLDHVLPLVLACRGAVVLHGGVVGTQGQGVVIVGPSGVGKSTLTAYLAQRGWTIGGDDAAMLRPGHPPTAEPTYSTIRLTSAGAALLGVTVDPGSQVVGKWRLDGVGPQAFSGAALPLAVVALLRPASRDAPAVAATLRGAAAHSEIFSCTFQVSRSAAALSQVIDMIGALVDQSVVLRLDVPRGLPGLAAAEALLLERVAS